MHDEMFWVLSPPHKAAALFVEAAASVKHGRRAAAGSLWTETKGRCRVVQKLI